MSLLPGQVLQSRYRILRLLGQGGMGAVYLAEDLHQPGRLCAVKESIPDTNASVEVLKQIRKQFQAEAGVLAHLNHKNLTKVSNFFSEGVNEYIVMEFVEGDDLACHLTKQGRPLPEKPVLIWADQVLDALEYLHGQQPKAIIHRDIKPGNIILAGNRIKLVDFGLVKLLDPTRPATKTLMKGLGTPEYAPLEQYAGHMHTDARTDIYALGATLYHLLTNVSPPNVSLRQLDATALKPPRQIVPTLSAATQTAVLKAIEILPKDRFQTAHKFRMALTAARTALHTPPRPAQPQPPTVSALGIIACPRCGRANAPDEIYCQACGTPLLRKKQCPHCGSTEVPENAIHCPDCGRVVTAMPITCPRCGRPNAPAEIYCQHCTIPITGTFTCRRCQQSVPLNMRYCPQCGGKA